MDIKDKEKLEKEKALDNKRNEQKSPNFHEIARDENSNAPKGQVQHEPRKKHGDKKDERKQPGKPEGQENLNAMDNEDPQLETFGPTEFMDPQDLEDSEPDYLNQPQSMSRDLGSIYPGRASTREEREAKARERFEQRNRQSGGNERRGYGYGRQGRFEESQNWQGRNEDHAYDRRYLDTERGNYNRHQDYQDRQGYERNRNLEDEYPNDERNRYHYGPDRDERNGPDRGEGKASPYGRARAWDREEYRREAYGNPWRGSSRYDADDSAHNYSSARQNDWDEDSTRYRGYQETDYDDRDVRRRRDEGRKPWETSNDYDRDYDRRRYTDDSGRFRRRNDRNYEEDYGRSDFPRGRRRAEADDYYPERRSGDGYGKPRRREEDYRDWDDDRYADREEERRRRRNRRDDW